MIQQHINAPDIHVIPKLPPFEKLLTMDYDEIWQDAPAVEAEPHEVTCKQSRETMDFGKVDDYEEDMQAGIRYRACYGIIDERGHIFISDGMHRTESAKHAKVTIDVKVLRGAEEDAEFLASGANKFHGIPRNHADKQRSVKLALKNPEMRTRSNREIARWCGIDDKTVGNWRKKLEASAEIPQMQTRDVTRTGKDGKIQTYQIPIKGTEDFTLSELEQHISGYLAGNKKERESYLHNILNNTIAGQAYLREIESALQHEGKQQGKKWRKADLNKAARKLLDELVSLHCSGTQKNGQPCEFVGTEAQMFSTGEGLATKWYCAQCFSTIQQHDETQRRGDASGLDNLILLKLDGLTPEDKVKLLRKAIFDDTALESLAQQIPGFPNSAIRGRCNILFNRLSAENIIQENTLESARNLILCEKCNNPLPPKPLVECLDPKTDQILCDLCRGAREEEQPRRDFGNCAQCQNPLTGPGNFGEHPDGPICDRCMTEIVKARKAESGVKTAQREDVQTPEENFAFHVSDRDKIMRAGLKLLQTCWNEKQIKLYASKKSTVISDFMDGSGTWQKFEEFPTKKAMKERVKELELDEKIIFETHEHQVSVPTPVEVEGGRIATDFQEAIQQLSDQELHKLAGMIQAETDSRPVSKEEILRLQQLLRNPAITDHRRLAAIHRIDELGQEALKSLGWSSDPDAWYCNLHSGRRQQFKTFMCPQLDGKPKRISNILEHWELERESPETVESPTIKELCADCDFHRSRNNSKHGKTYGKHYHGKCIREGGFCEQVEVLINQEKTEQKPEQHESIEETTLAQEYQRAVDEIIRLKRDEGLSVRSMTLYLKEHGFRNDKGHSWSKSAIDRVIQQARKEGIEI